MENISIGVSDDYAVVDLGNGDKFYYGYENTVGIGPDKQWAFHARYRGEEFTLSTTQLEKYMTNKGEMPEYYLLVGMALVLRHHGE